jgi:gluconate 2-dehydrogenase gamma chain
MRRVSSSHNKVDIYRAHHLHCCIYSDFLSAAFFDFKKERYMFKPSRRELLRKAMMAGSAAAVSSLVEGPVALAQTNPLLPRSPNFQRYSYFTADELAFVNAILDRLIPSDALGPGARAAGVAWFIDQQLAGPYGRAERWYMQGPWREGTPEQGYQLRATPAQLYRQGIQAVDAYCRKNYSNRSFAKLAADDQEKLMHAMDEGQLKLSSAPTKEFFKMLQQNAIEGYLADPMYGGNRDFAGWKLIGFPGPRYNYMQEITQYGRRYNRPFIGLNGYGGKPGPV